MTIKEVYDAMVEESLTIQKAAIIFDIPASTLYYHLRNFCKKNELQLPRQKVGRKKITKVFSRNEIYSKNHV